MDGSNWSRPRTGSPAVRVVCPMSRTTREEGHAEYEESRLVRFQLNMPNSWYHTRLPKGVRDGQELDVAGPDSPRAASAGRETERSVVVGPDIPALPSHRGSAQGPRHDRGCRSGGVSFHGGLRLGPSVQRQRLFKLRASVQPQGPAADLEGRAAARAGRGGVVEPRGTGAAVFQLVGAQARRVLPQPALAAAGHRRMGPAAVAPRGLERATHPDLETLP